MNKASQKVFVAMSGGVDSSVAAALLKEQGYEVIGVTMCFSINHPNSKRPSCCGAEGIADAKKVALALNIPHYVLDFAGSIEKYIIEDFIGEYKNARTPNPCMRCNQFLKFKILYDKVMAMGADYLATGHYAKIEYSKDKEIYELKKAKDEAKDQSYFLYGIEKQRLLKILFPLGSLKKDQVRELAKKYHLSIAHKQESQDICFVPEGGYKEFIKERLEQEEIKPGNFVNHRGDIVGQHKGVIHYTIGQRDKLGIALGYPAYVYKIDKKTNMIYVGPKECLSSMGLIAKDLNLLGDQINQEIIELRARIRYNATEVKGKLTVINSEHIRFDFDEPQQAVTPGQFVVFYLNDVVWGGAIIEEALH